MAHKNSITNSEPRVQQLVIESHWETGTRSKDLAGTGFRVISTRVGFQRPPFLFQLHKKQFNPMKKIISFLIAVSFIVPSFAFAQTTNTQIVYTSALRQLITLLIQEVTGLEQQLAALNAKQTALQSEIASTTLMTSVPAYTPSPTLEQLQQTAPQVVQTPPRAFTVREEAEVNLGSGFVRGVDMQRNFPTVTSGQIITGKLAFLCIYNSDEAGLPQFCTPPAASTSSLPFAYQIPLTVKIGNANNIASATSTVVMTDENGNFSFAIPSDCGIKTYHVSVYNGSTYMLDFFAYNSAFGSCATSTSTK